MADVSYYLAAATDHCASDVYGYSQARGWVDDVDTTGAWNSVSQRYAGINLGGVPSSITAATLALPRVNDNAGANGVIRVRCEASNTPAAFSTSSRPYSRTHRTAYIEHTFPADGTTQTVNVASLITDLLAAGYSYSGGASDAIVFTFGASNQWGITSCSWRHISKYYAEGTPEPLLSISYSTVSAAITGTATSSITEADVVTGGKTIIITLTGTTWKAA